MDFPRKGYVCRRPARPASAFIWTMSRLAVTWSTVPSRVGTVAGQIRSRSAPSDADFGGPSLDWSTEARKAPTVK